MNSPSIDPAHSHLEVRGTRASSVIVHRVPADSTERFLEWERGVTQAAEAFPGYQATDVYPPTDPKLPEWVVVIHFDNPGALQSWLDSPARAEWTAKLPADIADFHLKTLSAGFGPWFAGLVDAGGPLPHWKMYLAVLIALYPTVMLLTLFVAPHTEPRFGLAVAVLINNLTSVAFLEWLGMPLVNRWLGPWLRANEMKERTRSFIGLAVILVALGLMAFLFHFIKG